MISRRGVAIVVTVVTVGYVTGAVTATAAVHQTSKSQTHEVTCSRPPLSEQNTGEDRLGPQPNIGTRARNPATDIDYRTQPEHVKVLVDATSKPEGASMRPSIYSGNTVLLKNYTGENLESGQIIRYQSGAGHTIHRITASYDDTSGHVLTKGDNNDEPERVKVSTITHVAVGVLYT